MKLHEYQAKDLLRAHGVKVPPGIAATTTAEAVAAANSLGGNFWVVKAQVHAGGRGKGRFKEIEPTDVLERVVRGEADVPGKGGVQLCRSIDDVQAAADMMLGNTLDETRAFIDPDGPLLRGLDWSNLADRMAGQLRMDLLPAWIVAQYRAHHPDWSAERIFYAATTAGRSWPGQVIEAEARARADAPTWVYQVDFQSPT